MNILSRGEDVSNSVVLNIVSNSINRLKQIEKMNSKTVNGNNSTQQDENEQNNSEKHENSQNNINNKDNKNKEVNNNHNNNMNENKCDLDLNGAQTLSKEELWRLRVKKLNQFSIPYKDSSEVFDHHIEFLESVQKYTSSLSN